MRILMVGHYPPHTGGIANHLDNLVRELRKRHEVHILTYGPVTPREFEKEFVHQVKPPNFFGIRGISFTLLASKKIEDLCREYRFDLIHAHFIGTTSYAGILAKKRVRIPVVVTAHGSDLDFMSKLPLGTYYVKKSLSEADRVIAVSHYLAKKALSLGARSVHVVPNGVREFKLRKHKREFITFIGALRHYKSPETVLKLAEVFPDEKFLIVGDGPLRNILEEKAPPNVQFLGYRGDIENILSKTKILILPSKREGFGLVIIEANALGVPVIGRKVGGIPELIVEGKNGVTFKNFEELIEKFQEMLNLKKQRKMGTIGKRLSKKYTWKEIARKIEEIYEVTLHSL
ncbi:glycosyltransferase family 4 protein [Thermococcus sp. M39]|uniref:glycosyltransferase family 4 protein n=1 Tax=unclassified Thermococcus TaxID=2627626 RepID=UPI00143C064E|nr:MULTISPECIES: glycosyltransferase family 4 protein [unclassified Thermococcus]NJE07945.1 glycosyltransferase family 4 protein [Thermococcus sp. M39]NJE13643.1 glycosyltransferase family 4 protein [Thermococcus sp. LS2]